jgi:hypothetical protein
MESILILSCVQTQFVEGSLMMAGSSSFCGKRVKRTGKEEEEEEFCLQWENAVTFLFRCSKP